MAKTRDPNRAEKGDSKTNRFRVRYRQLRDELDSRKWKVTWRDIEDYISPIRGRYLYTDGSEKDNYGERRDQKIFNSTGTTALRTMAAGFMGGLTSPSRPWFLLGVPDSRLAEYPAVKEWLHSVREIMLSAYAQSNFYVAAHNFYEELGSFGTAAMHMEEDFNRGIRFRPYTAGEYMLAAGEDYLIDTMYRRFSLTARQICDIFAKKIDGSYDWDIVSNRVRTLMENKNSEERVMIVHVLQPGAYDRNKRYESVYYELDSGEEDKILRVEGYRQKPFVASRWDVTGTDVYGRSPGMTALGDIKQLQLMEEKKLKALDKMVDPPLNAPTSLENRGVTIVPGTVNFVDAQAGMQSVAPTYTVNPNIQSMAFEIDRVEKRIKEVFYNDMFMSLIGTTKRMTATEVAERHEEKLMLVGPVIERLENEFLDPVVEGTFSLLSGMGLIPPAPQELSGIPIKVEYIGLLSQAQKMVGSGAIEQIISFATIAASIKPDVIDKLDLDEAVDQYSDSLGTPPRIIRTDEDVAKIRNSRAQAEQAQAQLAAAAQMAESAKVMSDTQMGTGSALDGFLGNQ